MLRPTDSPLSKEITALRFSKKFVMPSFDYYSGTSDPLHLRQYQNKMAISPTTTSFSIEHSHPALPTTCFIHSCEIFMR